MAETYLNLIYKYPNAKEDLLNLRREKNYALCVSLMGSFIIGFMLAWRFV